MKTHMENWNLRNRGIKEAMFCLLIISFGAGTLSAQSNQQDILKPKMPGTTETGNVVQGLILNDTNANKQLKGDSSFSDGYYNYDAFKGAKPIPLPNVSMGNVRFYKRIYRDIDLNDSVNNVMAVSGSSLIEIIVEGVKNGSLIAFDANSTNANPNGDGFTVPLTPAQAMATLVDSVLVPHFDDNGNQTGAEMKLNDFNPSSVMKFRVKEDIFYDNQRSRIETRIVGIAPLKKIEATGELINEQPAFWLYYPQCREVFVTKAITDPRRNINNENFDDFFLQHSFKSTIVKEAGPADEKINSDDMEKQIARYKKETWKY